MNRIWCNPLDISYRYQDIRFSGRVGGIQIGPARRSVHREAADPSIVRYRDRYFMFASMSRGFRPASAMASRDACSISSSGECTEPRT